MFRGICCCHGFWLALKGAPLPYVFDLRGCEAIQHAGPEDHVDRVGVTSVPLVR